MTHTRRVGSILRNRFISGLVVLVPIVLTVKALGWLFAFVDGMAEPLAVALVGRAVPGLGFALTLAIVFVTGVIFALGPFARLLDWVDDGLDAVPIVGTVYGTTKKVLEGFGGPGGRNAFRRFVLARLPGRTTPGFLTGEFTLQMKDGSSFAVCTVYVPTNHLYVGDVVVLPREDVVDLDVSVEDGISLMLSAGASVPPTVREQ